MKTGTSGAVILDISCLTASSDLEAQEQDRLRQLTDDPAWDGFPQWSPDGSRIACRHGTLALLAIQLGIARCVHTGWDRPVLPVAARAERVVGHAGYLAPHRNVVGTVPGGLAVVRHDVVAGAMHERHAGVGVGRERIRVEVARGKGSRRLIIAR
jgi:hypothetical protein